MRSLSSDERLKELENELGKIKWDIIGLSEMRRKGEELVELPSGHMYHKGKEENSNGGVGFIINRKIKDKIT